MKILLKCVCNRPSCAGAKDETIDAKADDAKWLIENGVGVAVSDDGEPVKEQSNEPTGNSDSASAEREPKAKKTK